MLLNVCIFFIFEMWVTLLQIVFYLFCFVLFCLNQSTCIQSIFSNIVLTILVITESKGNRTEPDK